MITSTLRIWAFGAILLLMTIYASRADDQTITVELGSSVSLALDTPFDIFLIGNPDVIDVHGSDDRSVIVEGIALGTSNVVFVDERRIAIANIRVLVCDVTRP